jgi:predicted methyltransferase
MTEKEFFRYIKNKKYIKLPMFNPYLNILRSDRIWIINSDTKETVGHYRDSHYNGIGDFTVYDKPKKSLNEAKSS